MSGHDPGALLHAARGDAAAGHHLVEDRDGAVSLAQGEDLLEEAGDGRHDAHVADDRLDDHGRDGTAARCEQGAEGCDVVVRQRERVAMPRPRGRPPSQGRRTSRRPTLP